jgi:hypothetical protein
MCSPRRIGACLGVAVAGSTAAAHWVIGGLGLVVLATVPGIVILCCLRRHFALAVVPVQVGGARPRAAVVRPVGRASLERAGERRGASSLLFVIRFLPRAHRSRHAGSYREPSRCARCLWTRAPGPVVVRCFGGGRGGAPVAAPQIAGTFFEAVAWMVPLVVFLFLFDEHFLSHWARFPEKGACDGAIAGYAFTSYVLAGTLEEWLKVTTPSVRMHHHQDEGGGVTIEERS